MCVCIFAHHDCDAILLQTCLVVGDLTHPHHCCCTILLQVLEKGEVTSLKPFMRVGGLTMTVVIPVRLIWSPPCHMTQLVTVVIPIRPSRITFSLDADLPSVQGFP